MMMMMMASSPAPPFSSTSTTTRRKTRTFSRQQTLSSGPPLLPLLLLLVSPLLLSPPTLNVAFAFAPTTRQSVNSPSTRKIRIISPPFVSTGRNANANQQHDAFLSSISSSSLCLLKEEGILDSDNEVVDDDLKTYETNLQLAQLANRCASNNRRGNGGGQRGQSKLLAMSAYQMLQNMTHPDTVAYNSVLKAFAKSSPTKLPASNPEESSKWVTAAERAQSLLEEMIVVHEQQATSSQDWYIRNAQGLLTDIELEQGPPRVRVKPNVRSFSTVMDAWSRTGNIQACLQVLQQLEERYVASNKDVALQPNIFTYNTILATYSKKSRQQQQQAQEQDMDEGIQAAQQAEDFLEKMPVEPDVISYNAVLHAWARSGHPNAGQKATTILRKMTNKILREGKGVIPNSRTYTTVMDAWSRSEATESGVSPAKKAHELLEELKELYHDTGDQQLKPNCVSYSTVINAYALSKEPLKAQKAYQLLQEMITRGKEDEDPRVLPNVVTYNSVLNAAATSSPLVLDHDNHNSGSEEEEQQQRDKEERQDDDEEEEVCLQTIVQTLYYQLTQEQPNDKKENDTHKQQQQQQGRRNKKSKQNVLEPDHFTFGTVLKACANNIFWDDPSFGVYVFEEACRRGQVSKGVLVQLRQAVPMHTLSQFLPQGAYNPRNRQFSMSHIPDSWKRNVRERK